MVAHQATPMGTRPADIRQGAEVGRRIGPVSVTHAEELKEFRLLANLQRGGPDVCEASRNRKTKPTAMGLNTGHDWSVQSVEPRPCDAIANPCPPYISRIPVRKVRRDVGVRVQEQRIANGCEWNPHLVGNGPTWERGLIHHQRRHATRTHHGRPDFQHRISRTCTDRKSMFECCPVLKRAELLKLGLVHISRKNCPLRATISNPASEIDKGGLPNKKKVTRCPRVRIASASATIGLRCPGTFGQMIPTWLIAYLMLRPI